MKHGFHDSYTGQSFCRHLNQRELNLDKNQSSTRVQRAKLSLCRPLVSGSRAAEAPGRAQGARARGRPESSDQRAAGAPSRRPQGAAADALERLAGAPAGGGECAAPCWPHTVLLPCLHA